MIIKDSYYVSIENIPISKYKGNIFYKMPFLKANGLLVEINIYPILTFKILVDGVVYKYIYANAKDKYGKYFLLNDFFNKETIGISRYSRFIREDINSKYIKLTYSTTIRNISGKECPRKIREYIDSLRP